MNSFNALMSVITPISEAFRNIFPPMTAEQLYSFTETVKEVTASFILTEEQGNKLKTAFEGIFSVFKLVGEVIMAVGSGLASLVGFILPTTDSILGLAESFGLFLTEMTTVDVSTFFKEQFDNLIATLQEFKVIFNGWIDGLFPDGAVIQANIMGFFGSIPSVFNSVLQILSNLGTSIVAMFDSIVNALKTGFNKIKDIFKNSFIGADFNIDGFTEILGTGALTAIAAAFAKFIWNLGTALKDSGGIVDSIKDIFDGVADALKGLEMSVKADAIQKIATAIAILTGSLVVLSLIDADALARALLGITTLFINLSSSMKTLGGLQSLKDNAALGPMVASMISLAAALLLLAIAVKTLSSLSFDELLVGLVGISGGMLVLVGALKMMQGHQAGISITAGTFLVLGAGLAVLSAAIRLFATMDLGQIALGLIALGGTLAGLSVFLNYTKLESMSFSKGVGFIALAKAINMLAEAVYMFAALSPEELTKGLIGVGVVLAELGLFTALAGSAKNMAPTGVGLVLLSAALTVLVGVVQKMGEIPFEPLVQGIAALGAILLVLAASVKIMSGSNTMTIGAGLILISTAMLLLSGVMAIFGNMGWEAIGKGLTVLAGALGIFAIADNAMDGAMSGAAALAVVAASLLLLVPAFALLGALPIAVIVAGLGALAGILAIFGAAAYILAPVSPVLLALGGAIALLGIGTATAGAGMLMMVTALLQLVGVTTAGAIAIVAAITTIVIGVAALIPQIGTAIAQGIITFAQTIGDGAPVIAQSVLSVLQSILTVITQAFPMVINAVGALATAILVAIVQHGPTIMTGLVTLMVQLLNTITANIPVLIQAGINAMVGLINGMANGIRENGPIVLEAVKNLLSSIIEFAITALSEFASMIPVVGDKLSEGLDKAKLKVQETLAPQTMQQVGADGANALVAGIESAAPAAEGAGVTLGTSANTGVESILTMLGDVGATGGNLFSSGLSGTSGEANAAGALVSGQGVAGLMANSGLFGTSGTTSGSSYAAALAGTSGEAGAAGGVLSADAVAALMSNTDMFTGAGNVDVTAFLGGMEQGGSNANESGASVSGQAVEGMESVTDEFTGVGTEQGKKYTTEIDNNKDEAKAAGITVSSEAVTGLKSNYENFKAAGKADGEGYVLGLRESMNEARIAGFELGEASLTGTTTAIDSNSPSKEAEKIGVDYGDGYILGIGTMIPLALTAGMKLGEASREGLEFGTDNADFFNMGAKTGELFVSGLNSMGEAIKASMSLAFGADEEVTKNMNEKIDSALQTIESRIDSYTNTATDRLSVLSSETDVTVEEMISNLQKNQEALMEWANNIALLAERGLNEGLLEELRAAGPESAGQVRALVDASASELAELNTVFAQGGAVASQALATSVGQAAPLMQQEGQNLVDALATALTSSTSLNDAMAILIGSAKNAGAANVAEFATLGSEMATSFTTALETQAAAAQTSGSSVGTAAVTGLKTNQAEYVATGQKGGTDFNLGLGSTSTAANQSGVKVTTEAEQGIKSNEEVYGQTGDKYGKDFADELDNAAPQAKTAGQTLANAGVEGVNSRVSEFRKAGQNAGKGFVDGLSEYIDEAENVGRRMASAALTSLEDALDERSPSKETEKRGIYFGEGFINGIKAMVSKVGTMTASMGNNALDALRNAIHQASSLISSDLDLTPTIRPVLDLSEIQNGSRNLDSIFSAERTIGLSRNMVSNSTASKVLAAEESLAKNAQSPQIQFIQNNTSPKALSRIEIYRQTRNLFALQRGVVESV